MTDLTFYVLLGIAAGVFSGLIGIGGGVIIVPALVFLFGFSHTKLTLFTERSPLWTAKEKLESSWSGS